MKAKLDIEARELDLTESIERAQEHSNPRLSLTGHSRNPAAVTSSADPVTIARPGEIVTEIGPLSSKDTDTTTAAVEMLQRLGFGAEKQDWPSPLFGPVLPGVLEQLKRARRILTTKGFLVVGDPLNPLGDGRSWVLRFEPTEKLPTGADFAELADQYLQSQGITVAAKPVQDGRTFLVALWDSDRVRRRETRSKREAFVARNKRTMVDSDFWRDLAAQFLELRDTGSLRAGEVNDFTYIALETLAKRGASKIASAGAPDLLAIWLEELRREGFAFRRSGQPREALRAEEYAHSITRGTIDGICRASATFCKKLEDQAVQAEFEEKQRNTLENWSQPLRLANGNSKLPAQPSKTDSDAWIRRADELLAKHPSANYHRASELYQFATSMLSTLYGVESPEMQSLRSNAELASKDKSAFQAGHISLLAQGAIKAARDDLKAGLIGNLKTAPEVVHEPTTEGAVTGVLFPKLKSPLKKAVYACLAQNPDASDKEILDWLRQNNPKVIPAGWDSDDSLPGKTFTKVRKYLADHRATQSTAITRRSTPPPLL